MTDRILIAILIVVVAYIAYDKLGPILKAWAAQRAKAKAATELSPEFKALMAGTIKACEAIAEATVALQSEVQRFRETLTGDKSSAEVHSYPEDNYSAPPTQAAAEALRDTFEKVAAGMSLKAAEEEAAAESEKKMMYSGAVLDVE